MAMTSEFMEQRMKTIVQLVQDGDPYCAWVLTVAPGMSVRQSWALKELVKKQIRYAGLTVDWSEMDDSDE